MITKSLCPIRLLMVCALIAYSTTTYSAGWSGAAMPTSNGFSAGYSAFQQVQMRSTSMYLHTAGANYSSYYATASHRRDVITTLGEKTIVEEEMKPITGLRMDPELPPPPGPIVDPSQMLPIGDAVLPLLLIVMAYAAWKATRKKKAEAC